MSSSNRASAGKEREEKKENEEEEERVGPFKTVGEYWEWSLQMRRSVGEAAKLNDPNRR